MEFENEGSNIQIKFNSRSKQGTFLKEKKCMSSCSIFKSCFPQYFKNPDIDDLSFDLVMYSLTCNKISHCLFDFDCPDFEKVYKNERYKFDQFRLSNLRTVNLSNNDKFQKHFCHQASQTLNDTNMINENNKIRLVTNYKNSDQQYPTDENIDKEKFTLRFMFKPQTGILWGFHKFQEDSKYFEKNMDVEMVKQMLYN